MPAPPPWRGLPVCRVGIRADVLVSSASERTCRDESNLISARQVECSAPQALRGRAIADTEAATCSAARSCRPSPPPRWRLRPRPPLRKSPSNSASTRTLSALSSGKACNCSITPRARSSTPSNFPHWEIMAASTPANPQRKTARRSSTSRSIADGLHLRRARASQERSPGPPADARGTQGVPRCRRQGHARVHGFERGPPGPAADRSAHGNYNQGLPLGPLRSAGSGYEDRARKSLGRHAGARSQNHHRRGREGLRRLLPGQRESDLVRRRSDGQPGNARALCGHHLHPGFIVFEYAHGAADSGPPWATATSISLPS